jgi:hypothetical protein
MFLTNSFGEREHNRQIGPERSTPSILNRRLIGRGLAIRVVRGIIEGFMMVLGDVTSGVSNAIHTVCNDFIGRHRASR